MRVATDQPNSAPLVRGRWHEVVADLISLTKPRLSGEVLFTTAGGLWLSGVEFGLARWIFTLLATAGTVGAANAFNCYLERDSDLLMKRTSTRPLPTQRMEPVVALAFASLLALVSLPALVYWANPLTGALGAAALYSYVLAYTPLKRRSHWAMLIGAFPGALPPLMGWTAATGRIDGPGLALFGILFFWQLPHFLAIALFRKEEYRAAGLQTVPIAKGDQTARVQAVLYAAALVAVSVLPFKQGVAGPIYLAVALVLGAAFLGMAVVGAVKQSGVKWARKFFFLSLIYLTGLFLALGIDGRA